VIVRTALALFFVIAVGVAASGQARPKTIVLDGEVLEKQRREFASSTNKDLLELITGLSKKADRIVKEGRVYSVTTKVPTPPSGDRHDYMSQAPYWWPDPSKPNGLPYIRKDGERNPELLKISDPAEMGGMLNDAELLALAYYFTKNEAYAKQSAALLRTWFLDPKTRQNPNLNYAQGIPGISKGRGIGLIETRHLYRAIDASILLDGSQAWTETDKSGFKKWFSQFLTWMLESPVGKDEADERNNHGTHYDVQIVAYSIFTGRRDLAVKQLAVTKDRIRSQIEPDGRQPHELERTLSWGYVNMNLQGFFTIARMAESVDIDLWKYQTSDGRGIKKAFEWLFLFTKNEKDWTYQQIKPRTFELTEGLLKTASRKFASDEYSSVAKRISPDGRKLELKDLGNY
jgi:hypothetical protein